MYLKNDPLFSIVVPLFNSEKFVERCIESIINQSYDNWELILVDDGSTDNSVVLCQKFLVRYPQKIRVIISNNNEGQLSSRFKGVSASKGDYILYLDSDDSYISEALFLINKKIDKNVDLVSFNPFVINLGSQKKTIDFSFDDLVLLGTDKIINEYLCNKIYGYSCFFAIKKIIALQAFYDIKDFFYLRYTEDLLYMYHVFLRSSLCIQMSDKLYNYFVMDNSASTNLDIQKYKDRFVSFNYIYGTNNVVTNVSCNTKLSILFTMLSYARKSSFLSISDAKRNLKDIRSSGLFKKYKKANVIGDRISKLLFKILSMRMFLLFIVISRNYYKNYEKNH